MHCYLDVILGPVQEHFVDVALVVDADEHTLNNIFLNCYT